MKKTQKTQIHESLTSMNSLSYSIISYGIFYGIKQAAFFFKLFEFLIPNEYLRFVPSLFFGYFISRAMLNITANLSKNNEWVSISIAAFDFMVLCVIIDVLNQKNWIAITNLLIFCAFVTYLGFWLNKVFINNIKQKRKEAKELQEIADKEHLLTNVKQNITDTEQNLKEIEQDLAEKKQELQSIKEEIADTTCPHCLERFPNKKSRDAHKGRCKSNPKNKNKIQETIKRKQK